MKRSILMLAAAVALGACDNEITAPSEFDEIFDEFAVLAYDAAGLSGPGRYLRGFHRLPEDLRLTPEQSAPIHAALEQFHQAVRPDREALAAIHAQARAALEAGKSREEVREIRAQAIPIVARIAEAEAALLAQIESILTPAQKAWLEANLPERCDRSAVPLTEEQRTQIAVLIAAFEESNSPDLAAIRAALEAARVARESGAPRSEIRAILEAVRPARERLAATQAELHNAIQALLTGAQKASGCYRAPRFLKHTR